MGEIIIGILIKAIEDAVSNAIEKGINYIIRKVVDDVGRVATQIIYRYDDDEDGEYDREEIILTLDTLIPDLSNGYCLCNKGNEIGFGFPQYRIIDGKELPSMLGNVKLLDGDDVFYPPAVPDDSFDIVSGNDNGFIVDVDNDGEYDDILLPTSDFTGDGLPDWRWLVDDDNDGLPDVSPYSPFYPIGSEEYETVLERSGQADNGIMSKKLDKYTVSEGLLALILLFTVFNFVRGLFRRSDYFK